jgi:mannose-1-phosphate guanylyltransferase
VVVLAGGPGRRLPPYQTPFPKALVPVGPTHAVIEVILRQLRAQGFVDVTLAIGQLGSLVRAYCGDGSRWGLQVRYWEEDEPLGTLGPLVAHLDELSEDPLVVNGDVLTDLDFRALMAEHRRAAAPATVVTCERTVTLDFGVLHLGGEGSREIVAFDEKPPVRVDVSAGVYAISRKALAAYPVGSPLNFDRFMTDLITAGQWPRAFPFDGLWLDLGRTEDYALAGARWDELAPRLLPPA